MGLYQQICEKDQLDEKAWAMLGIVHGKLNALDKAESCLKQALKLAPDNLDALSGLGLLFHNKGLSDKAIACYRKVLVQYPGHVDTLFGLGNAYAQADQLTEAHQCYERILQQRPLHMGALLNLANVMAYQGKSEQALSYYRKLLNYEPYAHLHSNLLLCLHYPATYDPPAVFNEHLAWASAHERGRGALVSQKFDLSHDRILRIGYVTPDLHGHSVASFFEPLLKHHDHKRFEIYCYVEAAATPDAIKEPLWRLPNAVRNTSGQPDDNVAAMIRDDQIDILVDLAGHTDHNRLSVFARKPAPLQITYLGYPNTTGLRAMDYRITDAWADPPGLTEHLHTEKLVRLETGFICFTPPVESPKVTSLPAIERGYVTFGSFNVLTKITLEMLWVWAQILHKVPSARLLIKNKQLTDIALQTRLYAQFEKYGVASERIDMLGRTSKEEHMASYNQVDIALDTFPYHGTTTTCDTLWMGVPVITLAGASHVSRVGVSLLHRIGLSHLIGNDEQEYIDHAVRLACDMVQLSELRNGLREIVIQSGLCDGLSFTRNLESLYRQLWKTRGGDDQRLVTQ